MKFDQDFIEKVRAATNLVDLISQHVELKKSGGGYFGLCPFRSEKTPSFSVSEDKQVYHCFGCKESGNAYGFVQKFQGLTFPESVEFLARRAAIPLPETTKHGDGDRDKKTTFYRINEVASNFFQYELKKLKDDHPAWKYLKGRGISREFAEKHRIGYAPESWTALANALELKRVPLFMAASLGLIKSRVGAGKEGHYDLFRNRIVFPIYSPTEQCLGFGGRVLDNSLPKYLNSPDSPVFHKGQVFYGLDRSAKHIRTQDTAILVEGYTDWLALEKAGFLNAVATLGTAFTHFHAHLLTRYCANVVVLFDGDEAGRLAARRSLSILLAEGLYPKGIILPYELDPDEFLEQHGPAALKHALEKAHDLYDLVVEEEVRGHSGEPSEKIQILDRLGPILATVKDPRLQTLYVQNTADYLNVEIGLVRSSIRAQKSEPTRLPEPETRRTEQEVGVPRWIEIVNPPRPELDLLNVALMREPYFKQVLDSQIMPKLTHAGIREAFSTAMEAYGQSLCKFDNLTTLLVSRVKPAEMVTLQLVEPFRSLSEETARKFIHDCIRRIEENYQKLQSKALMSDLRGAEGEIRTEKMEQFMNVQRTRRQRDHEK